MWTCIDWLNFMTIIRCSVQDPRLRQRVLKQAYLYRLEAKINDKYVRTYIFREGSCRCIV